MKSNWLAGALLIMGIFSSSSFAQQAALEQDAAVVESLKKNGSNLNKPHNVDFFLIAPTQSAANSIAEEMKSLGYSVRGVTRVQKSNSWEVHAQRSIAPQLKTMQELTVSLTALAQKFGGIYDGWGTESVK